ncbi:MAG: guanylate kinase [Phycisphaerales bacterium]
MTAAEHADSLDHRLPTDTENGMLLVISGPSGVGKTTITRAIERSIPDATFSVSATTRPKTDADVEGVDYTFLSVERFEQLVEEDAFLEHATYAGNYYGTLRAPVEAQLERGRLVILEIDVQGAQIVKEKMPQAFAIFIEPPSEEELLNRLRARKRESEEIIQRRFAVARREIEQAKSCGAYDEFVVNDDLERAIQEAMGLVTERRSVK